VARVLFSEASMLRVRRQFFRPTDQGTCYRDIAEGLNKLRYSEFLRSVPRPAGASSSQSQFVPAAHAPLQLVSDR